MSAPSEKLAQSLEMLSKLQSSNGAAAIRSRDLTRTHRERLLANGFLQEVMKGWYIPSRPDEVKGRARPGMRRSGVFRQSIWKSALAGTGASRRNTRSLFMPATGRCPGNWS